MPEPVDPERPLSNWHREERLTLTRGQRAADILRNGMGSWFFVAGFGLVMIVWAVFNSGQRAWDPYPFILLNLFLSMLAGLQGSILLIAAKREIEEMMAINRTQLEVLRELRAELARRQT